MAQLDKFKRRLIRSVARLRVEETKPEKEVWEILSKEMGCDCGPLWDRMRALTVKKLGRLLTCGDNTEIIANVARPSDTDMLMFDLVLVHEDDVDVIGRDVISEKATDCKALEELFDLVQEFSLEETPASALPATWADALRYYNSKGNRLTSLMLLQRRWYQLKELTRASFYKLWQSYRGNTHLWNKARTDCALTDLQVAVAERYPYVITKPFPKWDELIKAGRVVLPHHFGQKDSEKSDSGSSGNEQDLVLVEPEVEIIDLGVDSDSETEREARSRDAVQPKSKEVQKRTNEGDTTSEVEYDPNITIKAEPPDGLSNVKILEATHIPVEPFDNNRQDEIKTEDVDPRIALKNDLLRNISQCMESTDELIKQCEPQADQSENVLNALNDVENQMENIIEPCSSVAVMEEAPEPQTNDNNIDEITQVKAVDYFRNKIVEEMSKTCDDEEYIKNTGQGSITNCNLRESNVPEDNIEDSLSPEKENTADDVKSSEEEEELEDIIKQTADDFVKKSKQSRAEPGALTLTDMTIVDDGIDFVDDGIEYNDDSEENMEIDGGTEKQEDGTLRFDLKLLMTPVIVTTRLDDMLTFKDREFFSVVDRGTIDSAELESKPKQSVKGPITEFQVKQENKSDNDDSDSDTSNYENDVISDDQRVKPTSYLLQKPKSRSYNPIQLCKNPDFNTRLKRLTFGFLSSERNRQFLSACKPATVDLHKAFEDKLVNGTLYLKQSVRIDFLKENSGQKDDHSVHTVSVVPSAMSVQSLIDSSKTNFQPSSTASSFDLTSDDMTERSKVIHLPDITQVRRINQKLLTAEVPPIRVQNNVASNYLKEQPVIENTVETIEEIAGIGPKFGNSNSQVIEKKNPFLSNLLVTHKPPSFPKKSVHENDYSLTEKSLTTLNVGTTQTFPENRVGRPRALNPDKPPASLDKPPANPDKPPANSDKPPRKPPTRPIYPHISWQSWNKLINRPLDDFLITHDTLLKMLSKAKNQPEYTLCVGNKNTTNVSKNSQKDMKTTVSKQKLSDSQKSKLIENQKDTQFDNMKTTVSKQKISESQKSKVIEDQMDTQCDKITKPKPRVRARKGIMKTICCWSRAWVYKSKGQLLRLPKHMCPIAACNCCCKDDLPQSKSKEIIENNDPIELSDEENDNNLTSVTRIIENVVQQSVQIPVPKLRVFPSDKQNCNNEAIADFTLGPTNAQNNIPLDNIVVQSACESSIVDNTLQNVVIDDESAPVAEVQGEVCVVADGSVPNKSVNLETPTEKPKRIYVIPEANVSKMNANNRKVYAKHNFEVVRTIKKISTPNQLDLSIPTPPLISSSASKRMYVKTVYSKPSQRPPSISMSTQTMDVPLLQNLCIESENKGIKKPNVMHQKQLVVDGTGPFTTPTTIVNQNKEHLIHLKASKFSSDNPIFLGKNKILLTTVKFPPDFESHKTENERKDNTVAPKVVPNFPLPEGVEIVLQPDGELACMVKPGVELDSTQISTLPSILEAVKQQINTQRPFVMNDVINLSDDENEEKNEINKDTSETNQENVLTTSVAQPHEEDDSLGVKMFEDTEKTQTDKTKGHENCQETDNQVNLLTQKEHTTTKLKICDDSSENHAVVSERENIIDIEKSNQEEINICQVRDGNTLKSQICDKNAAKSDEKKDEDQPCIDEDTSILQTETNNTLKPQNCDNSVAKSDEKKDKDQPCIDKDTSILQTETNKYTEVKLMDKIKSSTETEANKNETQENNERSASIRNVLSDLMEMSGISEEDIKTTPDASMVTLPPAVINIDAVNVANEINANANVISQFPDLTPVTSVAQLKYACEQNGKFFKLDFDTGTLVPISVCIKKKDVTTYKLKSDTVEFAVKETESGDKIGIPTISSNFQEERKSIVVRRFGRNKRNPEFSKPITILRHTRPSSLSHNQFQNRKRTLKRPRKYMVERIEAKIDLVDSDAPMEEEYLINSESDDDMAVTSKIPRDRIAHSRLAATSTVTEISDDSSDDEPLALKSKRMRSDVSVPTQVMTETDKNVGKEHEKNVQDISNIPVQHLVNEVVETEVGMPETEATDADSMELDPDMPGAAILEGLIPEPEADDLFESESSPEDSILGM